MPPKPPPAIRHFKPRDLAYIRLGGRRHYLGKYGSPESFSAYGQLCAELAAGVQQPQPIRDAAVSVNLLIDQFRQWAEKRYQKYGKQTSEIASFKACLRPIRELYGLTPADEFGPARLLAIRTKLVDAGICRKRVNQHLYRIRRVWNGE